MNSTYKDIAEYIVTLVNSGMFEIHECYVDNGFYQTYVLTYDKEVHKFKEEFDHLSVARKSMKQDLFDEAVKDLLDKYDIPIKTSK